MKKIKKREMTKFDYKIRNFAILSIVIFALCAIIFHSQISANEIKNDSIQEEIEQLQKEIDSANETLESLLENKTAQLNK